MLRLIKRLIQALIEDRERLVRLYLGNAGTDGDETAIRQHGSLAQSGPNAFPHLCCISYSRIGQ